ncbi:hypothetical protein TNCT_49611 [Trichonephila clavata]|uniref:Uncharacterized protein n=1 Tax=Trichonephila clavata TaxID=2740835 RepID=A0A8X6G4T3_TRICU|nr:hypothetical protein TNCT_49611 [Trichonephila clavata]
MSHLMRVNHEKHFTCDIAKRSHSMVPGHMPESGIPSSSQMRLVGNVEAERVIFKVVIKISAQKVGFCF